MLFHAVSRMAIHSEIMVRFAVLQASLIEGLTQGVCERKNRYTLHPGMGPEALNHPPFMAAMERSEGCARCCCAPYHSVMVEFKHTQVIHACCHHLALML